MYKHDIKRCEREAERPKNDQRYNSWDYQMVYSLRAHNLYGIVPKYNLIKNIGVDEFSEHGGISTNKSIVSYQQAIMTKRFCGINSFPLTFPIKHPKTVLTDLNFEEKLEKIVIPPIDFKTHIKIRIKNQIATHIILPLGRLIKRTLSISQDVSLVELCSNRIRRKKNRIKK